MAGDINKRIAQLRARRLGSDRMALDESVRRDVLAKALYPTPEPWEKRAANMPFTQYVAGALEPVDATYTRVSLETADRVGSQLKTRLTAAGISVDFRLQGSVPLNVHIRGVSDVDLLTFDTSFWTYDRQGPLSQRGIYHATPKNSLSVLTTLRQTSERALKEAFPAATVDTSGGKAISISGGSLPRVVDVVPSHWHDNLDYQGTLMEHDRGVTILNKKVPETVGNLPFLHIKRITDRCNFVQGGLRKAIRLCKNVKADAEADGKTIALPSFDIAATMYLADAAALKVGAIFDLVILAETQRYLDRLACDHSYAKTLMVPDGSRLIFDTNEKLRGLNQLSIEMDALLRDVAKEHNSTLAFLSEPPLGTCREAIQFVSL